VAGVTLFLLRSGKSKPSEPVEAVEGAEPEPTDDELALLLGREEMRRAREKLIARAGIARARGASRGAPVEDDEEDALPH